MMKVLVTFVTTAILTVAGIGGFLVNEGNLTFNKVEQEHQRQVYVDGQLTSEHSWHELFGYNIQINLADSAYVGK